MGRCNCRSAHLSPWPAASCTDLVTPRKDKEGACNACPFDQRERPLCGLFTLAPFAVLTYTGGQALQGLRDGREGTASGCCRCAGGACRCAHAGQGACWRLHPGSTARVRLSWWRAGSAGVRARGGLGACPCEDAAGDSDREDVCETETGCGDGEICREGTCTIVVDSTADARPVHATAEEGCGSDLDCGPRFMCEDTMCVQRTKHRSKGLLIAGTMTMGVGFLTTITGIVLFAMGNNAQETEECWGGVTGGGIAPTPCPRASAPFALVRSRSLAR